MHVHRGSKNFGKRVSTNFANNSFETKRSFRHSKNHNREKKPDYDIVIKWLHLYCDMKLETFGIDRDKKTISIVHTDIHTAPTCTVSDRNSTSSHHRSEHTGRFIHTLTGGQTIHCTKL